METTSNNKVKAIAIIPFFNEEKHFPAIFQETIKYVDMIITIDDGSNDNGESKIPENKNILILSHESNRGKGAAINTGLHKAISINPKYTIILDADFQHPPEKIPEFISALEQYDIIVGNRKRERGVMPIHRRMSNSITSKLLSIKAGVPILDSQCGFRAFRTSILSEILPERTGFEAESEMLLNAARNNYTIGFIPIPTIYADEESKMKPLQAIIGFCKVLLS